MRIGTGPGIVRKPDVPGGRRALDDDVQRKATTMMQLLRRLARVVLSWLMDRI